MARHMSLWRVKYLGVGMMAFFLSTLGAAQNSQKSAAHPANENAVKRGEYIVNDVAVCSQCHTPRDNKGGADPNHWLVGAAVWFKPVQAVSNWPLQAPRLAGSPPASDDDMIKLLTTGIWTSGEELRPPMPQFRMSRDDAAAVVAYLKSLTPNAP
jgi:mono/diheme cytochrome c family protein